MEGTRPFSPSQHKREKAVWLQETTFYTGLCSVRHSPTLLLTLGNTYQANSLKSITQANMSSSTGHFIYSSMKLFMVGQQLLHSGYAYVVVIQANPIIDFVENFGYASLMV